MFLTDDYFSDINPRSLRRLMNVVYVMGKILKAFNIDFNWRQLSSWIMAVEQWPYRTSWIVNFIEQEGDNISNDLSLLSVYENIRSIIPKKNAVFNDQDRDHQKLEIFLKLHSKTLTVRVLKIFLPFTINLDPYIKKLIKEEMEEDEFQTVSKCRNIENEDPTSEQQLIPQPFRRAALVSLTVKQVCDLVVATKGLTVHKTKQYTDAVLMHNINGKVLQHCNLKELKQVMKFNFGDWELFKIILLAMKNNTHVEPFVLTHELKEEVVEAPTIKRIPLKHRESVMNQVALEEEAVAGLLGFIHGDTKGEDINEEFGNNVINESNKQNDVGVILYSDIPRSSQDLRRQEFLQPPSGSNSIPVLCVNGEEVHISRRTRARGSVTPPRLPSRPASSAALLLRQRPRSRSERSSTEPQEPAGGMMSFLNRSLGRMIEGGWNRKEDTSTEFYLEKSELD